MCAAIPLLSKHAFMTWTLTSLPLSLIYLQLQPQHPQLQFRLKKCLRLQSHHQQRHLHQWHQQILRQLQIYQQDHQILGSVTWTSVWQGLGVWHPMLLWMDRWVCAVFCNTLGRKVRLGSVWLGAISCNTLGRKFRLGSVRCNVL